MSDNVYTWIGYILAAIGILASWFFAKWSMRRKTITNFTKNEFGIGKSLCEEFKGLRLQFNGADVNNNLRVYRGVLMNTSSKDIPDSNNNKITIKFPEDCVIKDCNIHCGDVSVSYEFNNNPNELVLTFGLLQEKDCFEYDIIYEVANENFSVESDTLSFSYRIEDVGKEISTKTLTKPNLIPRRKKMMYTFIGATFIMGLCLLLPSMIGLPMKYQCYNKKTKEKVEVYKKTDSTYVVPNKNYFKFTGDVVPQSDFNKLYTFKFEEETNYQLLTGGLVIGYSILYFWLLGYPLFKESKINKYIEKCYKGE